MGAVAASGGYYVSMAADEIVANAGTITGSIGVVTGKLVSRELETSSGSDRTRCVPTPTPTRVVDQRTVHRRTARAREAEADLFYTDFVDRVAQGPQPRGRRRRSSCRVVWTGADAKEHGLVDRWAGCARPGHPGPKVLAGLDPDTECSGELSRFVVAGHVAAQAILDNPPPRAAAAMGALLQGSRCSGHWTRPSVR